MTPQPGFAWSNAAPWCFGQWTSCMKNRDCPLDTVCYHAEADRVRAEGDPA